MGKATWITGAALVACTGMVGFALAGNAGASTDRNDKAAPAAPVELEPATTAPAAKAPAAAPAKTTAAKPKVPAVLSGKRQVAIVRVQSFESAVSLLDDGRLSEVDGDEGRTLFVPTPLGRGKYLIKAFPETGNNEPDCWGVRHNGVNPLTVQAVACDAADRTQQFTITARGKVWAISNSDAYLQYSSRSGLILEELGDAPLRSTFRIVDNGAAPTYGD